MLNIREGLIIGLIRGPEKLFEYAKEFSEKRFGNTSIACYSIKFIFQSAQKEIDGATAYKNKMAHKQAFHQMQKVTFYISDNLLINSS